MDLLLWYTGILVLIVCLLLINRNIIGLPGYGFFYPLIIGYIIATPLVANERVGIALLATLIGWIIHNAIKQRVHLLVYPRYALYVICSLGIFLGISMWYGNILYHGSLSIEQIHMIMLSFIIVVASMPKIFNEGKWPLSLQRRWHIAYFLFFSWIINILISSNSLVEFFHHYRVVSIVLAILTIILWLYTGLQVKEMIRFRKLIWAKITNKKGRTKS